MERLDVAVIGGGLGGLIAANLARRQGLGVRVYEQAHEVGGRGRSVKENGFTFNLGPHAVYLGGPAERVLRKLGAKLAGGKPTTDKAFLIRRGELVPLPSSPMGFAFTDLMSASERMKLARAFWKVMSTRLESVANISLDAWLDGAVGGGEARKILQSLFRVGAYSDHSDQISAATALMQLRIALRPGVTYLNGGWQTLVDHLSKEVEIERSARVDAIERGFTLKFADGKSISADAVVVAAPPHVAAKLIPEIDPWTRGLVPLKAACLDVGLKSLPRKDRTLAFGLGDEPLYSVAHSEFAKLGPDGAAVIHTAKYLREEEDPAALRAELERTLDLFQPGWRDLVVESRFYPHLTVSNSLPLASRGGHRERPGPAVPDLPGAFVVGDWIGPDGHLLNAVAASAEAAVKAISSTRRRAATAS